MIDRRILLATTALAALRWLKGTPAQAGKFEIEKTDAEWRAQLTPQQYEILRKEGTERAWSSPLLKEHRKGIFACAGCDLPLFSSETKYESGTGWPSFYKALDNAVGTTAMAGMLIARSILWGDERWRLFSPFELVWAGGITGRVTGQLISIWGRGSSAAAGALARYRERARKQERLREERLAEANRQAATRPQRPRHPPDRPRPDRPREERPRAPAAAEIGEGEGASSP